MLSAYSSTSFGLTRPRFAMSRKELTPAEMPISASAAISSIQLAFRVRSEEHTSELQSLMRISYAVFCLKKKKNNNNQHTIHILIINNRSQCSIMNKTNYKLYTLKQY